MPVPSKYLLKLFIIVFVFVIFEGKNKRLLLLVVVVVVTNSQNPKRSDFEETHQFKRRRIVIDSSDESQ